MKLFKNNVLQKHKTTLEADYSKQKHIVSFHKIECF